MPASPGGMTIRSTCGSAHQPDGRLVAALVDDLVDDPERREAPDQGPGVVGLGEEVEVADRLPLAAERAGRLDAAEPGRVGERRDHVLDLLLRAVQEHPPRRRFEPVDPLEDERLGPLRQAAQAAQPAGLGGRAQIVDRLDLELGVELADGLRPETRDLEQVDEAWRDLGPQPVVEGHLARRGELGDLVADRRADARDPRPRPRPIGGHEVDRAAPDGIGGAVVGDGLEHELALDLEHVADLVEDAGEVAVGQGRLGVVVVVVRDVVVRVVDGVMGHRPMVAARRRPPGRDAATRRRPGRVRRAWRDRAPGPRSRRGRSIGWSGRSATATPTETETAAIAEPRQVERRDALAHALADLERDRLRRVAQQDDELLAAVARRDVVVADGPDDRTADRLEDVVAGGVPESVVEDLEAVDVDHQHADHVVRAPAPGEQAAELVEVAAVRAGR